MSEDRIAELEAAIEVLSAKNRELLGEVKTARAKAKGVEIDPAEHTALQSEVEALKAELTKVTKESHKTVEQLQKSLNDKDSALQSYLIDNGLTEALVKVGVRSEFMGAAKAMLRNQAQIKAEDGNYSALMGDKPLVDAVAEWAAGDEGKHFISAPANSGGGASGGSGSNPGAPKGNLGGDKNQRVNAIKQMFPNLAE
jgi:hypothetical protein